MTEESKVQVPKVLALKGVTGEGWPAAPEYTFLVGPREVYAWRELPMETMDT